MYRFDISIPELGEKLRRLPLAATPVAVAALSASRFPIQIEIPEWGPKVAAAAVKLATSLAPQSQQTPAATAVPRKPVSSSRYPIEIEIPEWGSRATAQAQVVVDFAATRESQLTLEATDGYPLAATLWEPARPNGIAVQINSAYAVPRQYYAPFARFLAGQGFTVLSYDYRGVGDSQAENWTGDAPLMRHWGQRDLAAVAHWLSARFPGYRLTAVGHSAGGQMLGLANNNKAFCAALAISSQSGHWRLYEFPYNLLAWSWFHVVVPSVALLSRWFPQLRRGGFAVPSDVALEWARWGRNPNYISDPQDHWSLRRHFVAYRGWMRLVHITDDHEYAPRRAVAELASFYRNARVEVIHRSPADWGVAKVGHFGYFRSWMPRSAWQETAQWLRSAALSPESTESMEAQP